MYNNYFPVTYPQAQPMSYPQYQQTQSTGINWVQGIEGAKAYPVAPNANVMLMDSENDFFYIKSSDQIGHPVIKVYEYKEYQEEQKKETEYVSKEEFEEFKNSLHEHNSAE